MSMNQRILCNLTSNLNKLKSFTNCITNLYSLHCKS